MLLALIDNLIDAVRAGESDDMLGRPMPVGTPVQHTAAAMPSPDILPVRRGGSWPGEKREAFTH